MVYGKTTNSDRARKNQRKSAKLAAEALFIASYAVLLLNKWNRVVLREAWV
jgi:hypothetical protein